MYIVCAVLNQVGHLRLICVWAPSDICLPSTLAGAHFAARLHSTKACYKLPRGSVSVLTVAVWLIGVLTVVLLWKRGNASCITLF